MIVITPFSEPSWCGGEGMCFDWHEQCSLWVGSLGQGSWRDHSLRRPLAQGHPPAKVGCSSPGQHCCLPCFISFRGGAISPMAPLFFIRFFTITARESGLLLRYPGSNRSVLYGRYALLQPIGMHDLYRFARDGDDDSDRQQCRDDRGPAVGDEGEW